MSLSKSTLAANRVASVDAPVGRGNDEADTGCVTPLPSVIKRPATDTLREENCPAVRVGVAEIT